MKIYMTFEANWKTRRVEKIFAKKEDAIKHLIERYKKSKVFGETSEARLRQHAINSLEEREVEGA